jgi:hypothetical protein
MDFLKHDVITSGYRETEFLVNESAQVVWPYLHVYKPHFFLTRIYPPKLMCGLCTKYYVLLTTEPATLTLYVVQLPVETASV